MTQQAQAADGRTNPIWGMLSQLGFPPAQDVFAEAQKLRVVAEQAAPHLKALAENSASLPELVQAFKGVNPKDINRLVKVLEELNQNAGPLLPLLKKLAS